MLLEVLKLVFAFILGSHNSQSEKQESNVWIKVELYPSVLPATWVFEKGPSTPEYVWFHIFGCDGRLYVARYLITNSYVMCGAGDRISQIMTGIPTGTNAAPEITNLYLFFYEFSFFQKHFPNWASLMGCRDVFDLAIGGRV